MKNILTLNTVVKTETGESPNPTLYGEHVEPISYPSVASLWRRATLEKIAGALGISSS